MKLRKMEVRVEERGRKRKKEKRRRNKDSRGRRRKAKLETAVRRVICNYPLSPLLQLLFLRCIHFVSSFTYLFFLLLLFSLSFSFLFPFALPSFLRIFSFIRFCLHVLQFMSFNDVRIQIFFLKVFKYFIHIQIASNIIRNRKLFKILRNLENFECLKLSKVLNIQKIFFRSN